MAQAENGLEVNVGDSIQIATKTIVVRGVVATVDYWHGSGWDIEIDKANVSGGYSRWKQWQDGGKIVKINDQYV